MGATCPLQGPCQLAWEGGNLLASVGSGGAPLPTFPPDLMRTKSSVPSTSEGKWQGLPPVLAPTTLTCPGSHTHSRSTKIRVSKAVPPSLSGPAMVCLVCLTALLAPSLPLTHSDYLSRGARSNNARFCTV